MTWAQVLQEVRPMRFEELYERRQQRTLTMAAAAEILGITERTFRRWSGRYDEEGAKGLQDRRVGQLSARAVPVDEALRMVTLYETRYTGWTVKHFHERWLAEHGGPRSYSWTKKTLQAAGQVVRAPRRGAHRKKRPSKPLPGMMLHQDGSTHEWVPGCQWDLIVTLDDATTEIYSAFFVEEEGTLSSFRGAAGGDGEQGAVQFPLYRSGFALLAHRRGRRQSRQGSADAGASRVAATGGDAHSRLFAGSAGAVGARLPHPAGPAAQRTGPGWDHGDGGSQPVSDRAVPPPV